MIKQASLWNLELLQTEFPKFQFKMANANQLQILIPWTDQQKFNTLTLICAYNRINHKFCLTDCGNLVHLANLSNNQIQLKELTKLAIYYHLQTSSKNNLTIYRHFFGKTKLAEVLQNFTKFLVACQEYIQN